MYLTIFAVASLHVAAPVDWSVCSWVYRLENAYILTYVWLTIFVLLGRVHISGTCAIVFVNVLVIRIPSSWGTGLSVLKTRSGRLASAIPGNPLLYPISGRDHPKPERGVLVVQIIFLQNNLFIFNLLSACVQPHTPTTHTTKPHTTEPEIPTTVCHIVIIFIIFLWYKTIFSTDPHYASLYLNKEKQKNSKGFPV